MRDPLRLGVVGCGRVFERFHLPALRTSSHWELAAVCDRDPRRQQWVERTLPGLAGFDSIDQMLNQVELDAVLIAAPPLEHTTMAARAIERGLHVLIEKPGGGNFADAEQIARLADPTDRVIWAGFNRRFVQHYETVRSILNAAPPPASVYVRFNMSFTVRDWGSISGYLGEGSIGGGVLYDVASHQLDLMSFMFSSPVVAVRSRAWDRISSIKERLSYDAKLGSGVTIQCLAEHAETYRESLIVDEAGRTLLSYPTGLLTTERASRQTLERWAKMRYWIDRKLIRFGILADPLQLSFHAQLEAFALTIRGGTPRVEGSDMNSLLATHRTMEAISDGPDSLGEWRKVATDGRLG